MIKPLAITKIYKMDSFLSSDVRLLLNFIADVPNTFCNEHINCITDTMTIGWNRVDEMVEFADIEIREQQQDWFIDTISKLSIMWRQAEICLRNSSVDQRFMLIQNSSWTDRTNDIKTYLNKFLNSEGCCVENIEIVLLLSSIIERALGDVLSIQVKTVPLLIRDLLNSPELAQTFGKIPMVFLQILFGSPLGLNLRNLVWHGFPSVWEIDSSFSAILFIIISSLGKILDDKGIFPKHRPLIKNMDGYFFEINNSLNSLECKIGLDEIMSIVNSTSCIPKQHFSFWEYILKYCLEERWSEALVLLIPQIECIFRSIYCLVNNQPHRLLMAETKTLYTTMDEIFDHKQTIGNNFESNELYKLFDEPYVELIYDIFFFTSGPRLRDRLSHGEVAMENISNATIYTLLNSISYAIIYFEKYEQSNYLQNILCYKSKYHANSIMIKDIKKLLSRVQLIEHIPMPDAYKQIMESYNQDSFYVTNLNRLHERLIQDEKKHVTNRTFAYKSEKLMEFIEKLKVSVIQRPKSERNIIKSMRQIVENFMLCVTNIIESLNDKYILFVEFKLHSKRRETYFELIKILPLIYCTVYNTTMVLLIIFNAIQRDESICNATIVRLLKTLLQHAQNLSKCLHHERNKWKEAQIIMDNITDVISAMDII